MVSKEVMLPEVFCDRLFDGVDEIRLQLDKVEKEGRTFKTEDGVSIAGNALGDDYKCKRNWNAFVQCGDSGLVFSESGVRETAFFEAFPDGAGFIRGEGSSIEEAEQAAWDKYQLRLNCEHTFERDLNEGEIGDPHAATCTECGYRKLDFETTQTCFHLNCGKPANFTVYQDDKGFACAEHYFEGLRHQIGDLEDKGLDNRDDKLKHASLTFEISFYDVVNDSSLAEGKSEAEIYALVKGEFYSKQKVSHLAGMILDRMFFISRHSSDDGKDNEKRFPISLTDSIRLRRKLRSDKGFSKALSMAVLYLAGLKRREDVQDEVLSVTDLFFKSLTESSEDFLNRRA